MAFRLDRRMSWLDLRLGLRMLVRHPALTLVGGFGIAVAVALSVGFFSVMRAHIYPELPLPEGHRIVALENRDIVINDEERRSLHDFFAWRDELRTVVELSAFRRVPRNAALVGGAPESVRVTEMTASGFRVARVAPLLGRHLVDDDEVVGATHVVVIGHDVWENRFAGDPHVVGRELRIGGVPHTIVGVMPDGFAFPQNDRYWTALRAQPSSYERRAGPAIFIFGRLAPGVSMKQAQAELTAVGERTAAAFPETNAQLRPLVMPYTHSLTDVQGVTLWEVAQMQFMMTLLLLVVALNVAVLVYARTAARRREFAVRSALGASRSRIVGQLFGEALVFAVVASIAGLLLAQFGIDIANNILASELETGPPFWFDPGLRGETVLLTAGLAVLCAVIVGVLPGVQATRGRLGELRQGAAAGTGLGRTWTALIVAQVAIALAALPAAIGMGWLEIEKAAARPVFAAEEFVVVGVARNDDALASAQHDAGFGLQLEELMRRLDDDAGVAGVTFRASRSDRSDRVRVEGVAVPEGATAGHRVVAVGAAPELIDVLGLRVLRGRNLRASDVGEHATAVVVNESFVQQVLGGGDALGRRIRHVSPDEQAAAEAAPQWLEIVGVAQNMMVNRTNPQLVQPMVMYAVAPHEVANAWLTVRMRSGVEVTDMAARIREHAAAVDASLRLSEFRWLGDNNAQQQNVTRLIALAVSFVLLSVLLLSAAGIYAMMSFTVTQRRREIGIRSALGARPVQVLRSVFTRATAQIGAGLIVGIGSAALLDYTTGGQLLAGRGGVILPALTALMVGVGLMAALGPARRGLAIEPTEALRAEG
jgi:putative ABC transport system permease protein